MGRFRLSLFALRLVFLVTLGLLPGACHVTEPAMGAAAPTLQQWTGQNSGVTAASHRVLRDSAEWSAFWQGVDQAPPRAPDFARERAVAVFVGERRTGGYTVRVVSAGPHEGRFVVTYEESPPPRGTMVTQALTSPWVVALVPRSALPVDVRPATPLRPLPAQK